VTTPTLIGSAFFVVLAFAAADAPHFAPTEGGTIQKTVTTDLKAHSTEIHISLDGHDLPETMIAGMTITMSENQKLVMTDRYVKVAGGRPTELDRTFDELTRSTRQAQKPPGEGEEKVEEKSEKSDLEGAHVHYAWKADKKAYERTFAGEEKDAEPLAQLREDFDARDFLPHGDSAADVKVGDTWELDAKAFSLLMSPDRGFHFHEEGKEEKRTDQDTTKEMEDNLTGDGKVTFEKVREADGGRIAVLVIEGKIESKAKSEEGDMSISMEVEGRVLWDLVANRVDTLDLTGHSNLRLVGDQKMAQGGDDHTLHLDIKLEGDMHVEIDTKKP
jgi:hypothetical protein